MVDRLDYELRAIEADNLAETAYRVSIACSWRDIARGYRMLSDFIADAQADSEWRHRAPGDGGQPVAAPVRRAATPRSGRAADRLGTAGVEVWKRNNCVAHLSAEARHLWGQLREDWMASSQLARLCCCAPCGRGLSGKDLLFPCIELFLRDDTRVQEFLKSLELEINIVRVLNPHALFRNEGIRCLSSELTPIRGDVRIPVDISFWRLPRWGEAHFCLRDTSELDRGARAAASDYTVQSFYGFDLWIEVTCSAKRVHFRKEIGPHATSVPEATRWTGLRDGIEVLSHRDDACACAAH